MKGSKYKGHIAMLGANMMWGMMAPIAKIVMSTGTVSSLLLTNFRIIGAAALFWIASSFTKKHMYRHVTYCYLPEPDFSE